MITQGYHSFYTFSKVSNIEGFGGIIQSLLFVIVFELFTLYYLVRGKRLMAGFYSICYLIMNLFYYYTNFQDDNGSVYWTSLFLSFIIPFSIFNVAENIPKEMAIQEKGEEHKDVESLIEAKLSPIKTEIQEIKFKADWNKEINTNEPVRIVKKGKNDE